ncbi:MAG: BREX-3 system P-loop-containing protein BrxF [Armatimonadota bacterium]
MQDAVRQIQEALESISDRYYRLLLVVGEAGSGKTETLRALSSVEGYRYVNLGVELSERMSGLADEQRAIQVEAVLKDILATEPSNTFLVDNTEVLFSKSLQLDPFRALQNASRNTPVVAAWTGTYRDGTLTYAEPQHPEHRTCQNPDAVIVALP